MLKFVYDFFLLSPTFFLDREFIKILSRINNQVVITANVVKIMWLRPQTGPVDLILRIARIACANVEWIMNVRNLLLTWRKRNTKNSTKICVHGANWGECVNWKQYFIDLIIGTIRELFICHTASIRYAIIHTEHGY